MVQTRNTETWETLPGIECGDIGPKFGYNSKDNGFMIFRNVRIPRTQILSRYADVDREGNFKIKGDLRVLYSVMLMTRVMIAVGCAPNLAKALIIGTRYAVVRRQFSTQEGYILYTILNLFIEQKRNVNLWTIKLTCFNMFYKFDKVWVNGYCEWKTSVGGQIKLIFLPTNMD